FRSLRPATRLAAGHAPEGVDDAGQPSAGTDDAAVDPGAAVVRVEIRPKATCAAEGARDVLVVAVVAVARHRLHIPALRHGRVAVDPRVGADGTVLARGPRLPVGDAGQDALLRRSPRPSAHDVAHDVDDIVVEVVGQPVAHAGTGTGISTGVVAGSVRGRTSHSSSSSPMSPM